MGISNVNPFYGACLNPWNPAHIPGGSSGGSAAAVAAELCLGALGSDTAGSIRIPAALCGVVGLKPTRGRVSLRGVVPVSWNLDHAGPLARRVYDVAVMLQRLAGYDAADPYSINQPVDDYLAGLGDGVRGWRVAVADQGYFAQADPAIQAAVQAVARQFAQLGARVGSVDLPIALVGDLISTDAAAFHRQRLAARPADFGADVRARLQAAAAITAPEYALARHAQTQLTRQIENFFADYDLLLTPTTPTTAPARAELASPEGARRNLIRFTVPFSLAGVPALSLPAGFDAAGLPIGVQLVTRRWAEAALLRAGHAYEQATGWRLARPSLG
jgi:aspartyl-tRNA(Asn)/glutamyl-tRNA(Gln) amidotransferase subunit A